MKKKYSLIALAVVCALLVAILVTPTISWLFSSTETVVNTFEGGKISAKIDEAKVDEEGHIMQDEPRVTENHYKFLPGSVLDKDPTMTILKGSISSYAFVMVENTATITDSDPAEYIFTLDISDSWLKVAEKDGKTVYAYKNITAEATDDDIVLDPVFTKVTVSKDLTSADFDAAVEQNINVKAFAIQADNIEKNEAIDNAIAEFFGENSGITPTYVDITE